MDWPSRRLCDLFGIDVPLVQAPMSGACTPDLAAAVAGAGGLGSLGLSGHGVAEIEARCAAARRATTGALNFNFLLYEFGALTPPAWQDAAAPLAAARAARGVAPPPFPDPPPAGPAAKAEMIETALAQGPEVMSFHFRLPEPDLLDRIKARGCRVICTATTPQEAVALERAGADAVIAQGQEAGGHRGSHADPGGPAALVNQIGTFALVPAIRDAVSLPVIAAGGVADGRGMAAALVLGADGVQMGTAFLRCPESGVPAAHARALAAAGPGDTTVTRALSGRPARALRNALTAAFEGQEERAAPYPHQFAVTAPLREDSLARGDGDYLSLWAGQGVGLARAEPAAQVVARVAAEALAVLGRA